jgi:hypothetical protein
MEKTRSVHDALRTIIAAASVRHPEDEGLHAAHALATAIAETDAAVKDRDDRLLSRGLEALTSFMEARTH